MAPADLTGPELQPSERAFDANDAPAAVVEPAQDVAQDVTHVAAVDESTEPVARDVTQQAPLADAQPTEAAPEAEGAYTALDVPLSVDEAELVRTVVC